MEEQYRLACESSITMAEAAAKLGVHFNTFKTQAKKFGLYSPNPGGKGKSKPKVDGIGKFPLQDILDGKYPAYQTFKLKHRLFVEGLKSNECEICGISEWQNLPIECELDHIDGDRTNHRLENLRILCPNCHSQTSTYRAKNIK